MPDIPSRIADRLSAGLKKYQTIIANIKKRDAGESDTVTAVNDMLADVFGYDKFADVTSEFAIKGTYCDLAIRLDGTLRALIEVKAVGIELKDAHTQQALNYAANQGVDWVFLTNAATWRVYRTVFGKPIDQELIVDFNVETMSARAGSKDLDVLYLLCKEAWGKSVLRDYQAQREALGRYYLGALLLSEPVLRVMRRELKRVCPNVRVEAEEIRQALENDVIKREVLEGEKATKAKKKLTTALNKANREKASDGDGAAVVPLGEPACKTAAE